MSEPSDQAGNGPRQGQAERGGSLLSAEREDGPSVQALTLAQAEAVLKTVEGSQMYAYVVLSPLTGARTEELRALTWDHVDWEGAPGTTLPVPPHIAVWRSVRAGGDTETQDEKASQTIRNSLTYWTGLAR
jgi:integrase